MHTADRLVLAGTLGCLCTVLMAPARLHAGSAPFQLKLSSADHELISLPAGSAQQLVLDQDDPPASEPQEHQEPLGASGTGVFTITGAYVNDLGSIQSGQLHLGAHWFIHDGLSIGAQLELAGFSQPGQDTLAGGVDLLIRWHFIRTCRFTIFGEIGCGLLYARHPVPPGGTNWNFTPQAGGGVTWRLDDRLHLVAGLRWYHISNAQTGSSNPGMNAVQVYAGLGIEF